MSYKMGLGALKREGLFDTPLYKKGIKKTQNKPMETTNGTKVSG